ncbi:hypothetical protein HDV05_006356, partial [Chytridiales sp. JEL 0842]
TPKGDELNNAIKKTSLTIRYDTAKLFSFLSHHLALHPDLINEHRNLKQLASSIRDLQFRIQKFEEMQAKGYISLLHPKQLTRGRTSRKASTCSRETIEQQSPSREERLSISSYMKPRLSTKSTSELTPTEPTTPAAPSTFRRMSGAASAFFSKAKLGFGAGSLKTSVENLAPGPSENEEVASSPKTSPSIVIPQLRLSTTHSSSSPRSRRPSTDSVSSVASPHQDNGQAKQIGENDMVPRAEHHYPDSFLKNPLKKKAAGKLGAYVYGSSSRIGSVAGSRCGSTHSLAKPEGLGSMELHHTELKNIERAAKADE